MAGSSMGEGGRGTRPRIFHLCVRTCLYVLVRVGF